ncbi:acyl--CoA ligase [soil metagenome]
MTLFELLEHHQPSHPAIVVAGSGPTLTYEQLQQHVETLAKQLNRFGINRSDRVAMALPNGVEMIVSFLAATVAGTAAPLNPGYKLDEFRFYLEDTSARALIVPREGMDEAKSAAGDKTLIIEADLNSHGQVSFESTASGVSTKADRPESDDVALVLHTSGTTSRPKRVPLSHKNLLATAHTVAQTYKLTQDDVSLCVMPLFHVHGLVASTLATLATGGTVVIVPRFNPLSFWSTIREHGVSWYSAVPAIHQLLLSRNKSEVRPSGAEQLRFIRSCSSALASSTMEELERKFGAPVLEAYGMTEAAHQMASNPLSPGLRKPGSVGRETGVKIGILDEQGNELANGEKGEVAIKGPNVFGGYEENPEANATAFTNGWFRTGDQGYLDADGYLTLVGRIKELINRGGEKIAPQEVDEALAAHPAVSEAVCFSVQDRIYGEEVAAAVVLSSPETEAGLIEHCRSLLADFKCPKRIHIVEVIPRTATGKIQRRNVAAEIAKLGR